MWLLKQPLSSQYLTTLYHNTCLKRNYNCHASQETTIFNKPIQKGQYFNKRFYGDSKGADFDDNEKVCLKTDDVVVVTGRKQSRKDGTKLEATTDCKFYRENSNEYMLTDHSQYEEDPFRKCNKNKKMKKKSEEKVKNVASNRSGLAGVLLRCLWTGYVWSAFLNIVCDVLMFAGPLLLKSVVEQDHSTLKLILKKSLKQKFIFKYFNYSNLR